MTRKVRVRFAPSPTGPLHIGGVRTALYNYLFARKHGGDFILRIEDTDQKRFVPGAEDYINESLNWLNIAPDEGVQQGGPCAPYRQSERMATYRQYADQLVAAGHAYYAFDTEDDLNVMRERLEAARMPAKYDAASRMSMKNSLTLSEDEVNRRLENGDPYVIRIKLPRKEEVRFHDEVRGWVVVHTAQMDDKVLLKQDGLPTYHLANVVDDHVMDITHVIRGEEWLPSAPLHVLLYRYLGWEETMPKFAHLSLLLKPDGKGKLSKRDGDRLGFPVFPLEWNDPKSGEISSGYRESGYLPEAVLNMLALLGWHPSDNRELFSLDELVEAFSLEKVSKSGAKFDADKARWFNHQYLMQKDNSLIAAEIKQQLTDRDYSASQDYVEAVIGMMKEKVNFIPEIVEAGYFFFEDPTSYDEKVVNKRWNDDVVKHITNIADRWNSLEEFSAEMLESSFKTYAEETGINPGSLMQPIRLAVSGAAGGPPIYDMIALLGRETVVRRMTSADERIRLGSS
ncbi:MAG: glutamate--tRNA ligase [Flavobacteriales bacterium]|nr:glutamate--tRNA ligase [Bacteroidota bacterium]MCB9240027.1 glutamate--tRNA ligase [Flavobacteriales bacterium]